MKTLPSRKRKAALRLEALEVRDVPALVTAVWSDTFVDSIGVNGMSTVGVTDPRYPAFRDLLADLGVRHTRDGTRGNGRVWGTSTDLYNTLGVRTTFLTGQRVDDGINTPQFPEWRRPLDVSRVAAEVAEIRDRVPLGAIGAFEGPNEYDLYHDSREPDWVGKLRAYQTELFARVNADPLLLDKPVVGPTVTSHQAAAAVGNLSAQMDVGAGHFYQSTRPPGTTGWGGSFSFPPYGGGAYGSLNYNIAATRQMVDTRPIWSTENGYFTSGSGSVSEAVDAKYTPRMFAEFFRKGVQRSFKYNLVSSPGHDYGLLRADLTPKPSYTALKNLIDVLEDNTWDPATRAWARSGFAAGALDYTLTGSTANVRQMLFQKSDGDFYLMLWQEVYDPAYHTETWQPKYTGDRAVTFTAATPLAPGATVYTLNADGTMTTAAQALSNGQLSLSVPDRIMLVRLTPGTGLSATYYDNRDFTGATVARTDPTVNFTWGGGSPAAGIGADTFSARWTGQVRAVEAGTYTFRTYSDDGVRLWVNGTRIINNWTNHAATYNTGTATLTAGEMYDVRLEYYENTGQAVMRLEWQRPGQTGFAVVPRSHLFPGSNQLAARPAASADPVQALTESQLAPVAAEAVARWGRAGVDPAVLAGVTFVLTDLPGDQLALQLGATVYVDATAAGYGWFADPTPGDDEEFGAGVGPAGMDLLTTLQHELGNALGRPDEYEDEASVMFYALAPGVRRTAAPPDPGPPAGLGVLWGLVPDDEADALLAPSHRRRRA